MKKLLVGLCTVGLLASSLVHAVEHEWTNKQGKTIKAGFVSAGEETVTISMRGKSYVVKLADLSPQSRALAAKLRVQKSKAREPQNDKTPLVKTSELSPESRNRYGGLAANKLLQDLFSSGALAKAPTQPAILHVGKVRNDTQTYFDTDLLLQGMKRDILAGNRVKISTTEGSGGIRAAHFSLSGKIVEETSRVDKVTQKDFYFLLVLKIPNGRSLLEELLLRR